MAKWTQKDIDAIKQKQGAARGIVVTADIWCPTPSRTKNERTKTDEATIAQNLLLYEYGLSI